jgi:hypothetical protein
VRCGEPGNLGVVIVFLASEFARGKAQND